MAERIRQALLKKEDATIIRVKRVIGITSLSKSHIYYLSANGKFPRSIPLVPGGSARGWVESEVYEWVKSRIEARNQEIAK
jgi:prophage regulatory protein